MTTPRESAEQFNRENPAPEVLVRMVESHTYHGQQVEDPYGMFMRGDVPKAVDSLLKKEGMPDAATLRQNWLDAQSARTEAFINRSPGQAEALTQSLADLNNYPRYGSMVPGGPHYFYRVFDGTMEQVPLMICDEKDKSDARVLIDPLEFNPDGTTSIQAVYPSPDGRYVAYELCEAGSDYVTVRVRDVATGKENRKDMIPDVHSDCELEWADDGKSFDYLNWTGDKDGNWNYKIYTHPLGKNPKRDKVTLDLGVPNGSIHTIPLRDENGDPAAYQFVSMSTGDNRGNNGLYCRPAGSDEAFDKVLDDGIHMYAPVGMRGDRVVISTNYEAPEGKLVAVDPANPQPENWELVLAAKPGHYIQQVALRKDKLVIGYRHDAASKISVYDMDGKHLHDAPIPLQSSTFFGSGLPGESEMPMVVTQYNAPGTHGFYNPESNEVTLTPSAAEWSLENTVVERHYATSKDGTKVPMTVIRPKDMEFDGTAAVLMHGYGGFNSPMLPHTSMEIINWLQSGGVYVNTNLRGGGEFDREWYEQGRLLNKQNTFDDFAACGEYLIDNNFTSPERLAITGGSNGGLLTLATSHQRPELFGAVVSDVPVTDMLCDRWQSDYGNPKESKEDFDAAMAYSPLHTVKPDVAYPPTLVATADKDGRVAPEIHAYPYVATRQTDAPDSLCLLHVTKDAGHGSGRSTSQTLAETVKAYLFLEQALGPIDQQKYKAAMAEAGEGKWAKRVQRTAGAEQARAV